MDDPIQICVTAYALVGTALILCPQVKTIFPQLLFIRILFSLGASGLSTMITALLPGMMARGHQANPTAKAVTQSLVTIEQHFESSEFTANEQRVARIPPDHRNCEPAHTRFAGYVGLSSGCGALLALVVYLRLPDLLESIGLPPGQALATSYRIVGVVAFVLSATCMLGLRSVDDRHVKEWCKPPTIEHTSTAYGHGDLWKAIALGFRRPHLGLAYLGGFVARASSVGITSFIPLLVNAYFISSEICKEDQKSREDMRQHCRRAYVVAAQLTGVSQLVGLVFAPIFGFVADRYKRFNTMLLLAAFAGLIGYSLLATLQFPNVIGKTVEPWLFLIMALLGFSQIGAIVCSLGLLSRCVLEIQDDTNRRPAVMNMDEVNHGEQDCAPLLWKGPPSHDLQHMKGSIAGVYSLSGGGGILFLTMVGGYLFDGIPTAPFVIMSMFNAVLLISGTKCGLFAHILKR